MSFRAKAFAAISALFVLFVLASFSAGPASAAPPEANSKYRFALVGTPQKTEGGKSVVSLKLVRVADSKPVPGAVIFQTRADMGPDGMEMMTASVKVLPEKEPGIYPIEIEPGMAGSWALTLAAKVQGEMETAKGTLTVKLEK